MRFAWGYLKYKCWPLILLAVCTGLCAWVLTLYELPAEAAAYSGLLCLIVLVTTGTADFFRWRRKLLLLESLKGQAALLLSLIPESQNLEEAAYRTAAQRCPPWMPGYGKVWTTIRCGYTRSRRRFPLCG